MVRTPISPITADFTVPPYTYLELEHPGVHRVLSNYDVMGGPFSSAVEIATKKFYDANPKLIAAFVAAMKDAGDIVTHDRKQAMDAYRARSGDSATPDEIILRMLDDKNTNFDLAPTGVMKLADFMYEHQLLPRKPASWKDMFFPIAYGLNGN